MNKFVSMTRSTSGSKKKDAPRAGGARAYFVYILECSDGTLYTGIATDVAKRVVEHNESPRGARYTKSRRPVKLVYKEKAKTRSAALVREYALKQLSRKDKFALITTAKKSKKV